ncbi:MAG: recombinase family protein [Bacteroidetes bacterium]|nr:recombinase family protein [Bacteroidota bacterium]
MKIKYNRVSTINQSGNRFNADTDKYDLVLFDKISGSIPFRERPKGKELVKLVEDNKVSEIHIEELSRIGRSVGDCISVCEWLDSKGVNIIVRNLGLQSRPDGNPNPVWKIICATMSSLYAMELENILERTSTGRMVYVQNGGVLGRPRGTNESEKEFLNKKTSVSVVKSLKKGLSVRETSKVNGVSTRTVMKVKKSAQKHEILG